MKPNEWHSGVIVENMGEYCGDFADRAMCIDFQQPKEYQQKNLMCAALMRAYPFAPGHPVNITNFHLKLLFHFTTTLQATCLQVIRGRLLEQPFMPSHPYHKFCRVCKIFWLGHQNQDHPCAREEEERSRESALRRAMPN